MIIDLCQTNEKFRHHATQAVQFVIDNLRLLDDLEKEVSERMQLLNQEADSKEKYDNKGALWEEYARRIEAIVTPIASDGYKCSPHARPLCGNSTYDYLNDASTKISFIMKSVSLATVEISYGGLRDQFVLKFSNGIWNIRSKKYAFAGENSWATTYL